MANAFQPSGFQNPVVYDHQGFQVEGGVETNALVRALTVDQTTNMTADQWELDLNSSDPWRARSEVMTVDLKTGLLNDLDLADMVTHVKDGQVDEWELHFQPNAITGRMRGRDAAAGLLDKGLMITYLSGGKPVPTTPDDDLPPGLKAIPGVTQHLYLPGTWRASTICTDLAERCGLDISYQAPDYILREDVNVSGPALSAIHQVISPFNHFEPFKTDVWVEGKTLIIRQRPGLVEAPSPLGPSPASANTVTVQEARIKELMLRATFLNHVRILRLTGAPTAPCSNTLNLGDPFNEQSDLVQAGKQQSAAMQGGRTFNDGRAAGRAAFDAAQAKRAKERGTHLRITTRGVRRFDGIELTSQKTTYDMFKSKLVSTETKTTFADAYEFDQNCKIIGGGQERGSQILTEGPDPEDGVVRQLGRVTISLIYDSLNFLASQTETTEARVSGQFQTVKKVVKRYIDSGIKQHKVETTAYAADADGKLVFDSQWTNPGSGLRPGGPGRAPAAKQTLDIPTAFVAEVLDDVPGATDITIENDSLRQPELDLIRDQARASSGAWEYNVEFSALNIPWVRKGQMLLINNLVYEDTVSPVSLPAMFVYESRIEHVEDAQGSQSLVHVKAVFWSKTYGGGS